MMLVTRPNHDSGTNYLYFWSKLVIEDALDMGIKVIDLPGSKANKKLFTSYYKKFLPKLVFINGHGFDNVVTGYDNEVLIDDGKNKMDIPNSIVVARSCRCAKILGKYLVKKGCLAFIGYKDDYVIKMSRKYTTKPLIDPMAKLFLEPSNLIVKTILKGKTAGVADDKSKKMLIRNMAKVLSGSSKDKQDTAKWLFHDYNNQVIIGDTKAKL
jgi:hypothetical protein